MRIIMHKLKKLGDAGHMPLISYEKAIKADGESSSEESSSEEESENQSDSNSDVSPTAPKGFDAKRK